MKLLLDTHAFAWALAHSARLPEPVRDRITDPANDVWVGAATVYELDYKRSLDRELAILPADLVAAGVRLGYAWLDITPEHARIAANLDRDHKDPWDRLIAAQAIAEDLTVVTKDRALAALGARSIW